MVSFSKAIGSDNFCFFAIALEGCQCDSDVMPTKLLGQASWTTGVYGFRSDDPFDRLLIAQAINEPLISLKTDKKN